ncbi:MAG: 3-keto-disaccharide hydrolase [Opitutaceae bacterium]
MNALRLILLASLLPLLSGCHSTKSKPLFDDESAEGWAGAIENYTFADGEIRCNPGSGGTIYTKQTFTDFVVRFEFKLPEGGNNGLAIRYPGTGNPAYAGMCELQVLDNTAEKYAKLDTRQYHGSVYGMIAAKRGYLKPVGEWNTQTVTVIGSTIHVVLNGEVILDADLAEVTEFMNESAHPGKDNTSGHFGFAGHGDPVAFRNLSIKELTHAN